MWSYFYGGTCTECRWPALGAGLSRGRGDQYLGAPAGKWPYLISPVCTGCFSVLLVSGVSQDSVLDSLLFSPTPLGGVFLSCVTFPPLLTASKLPWVFFSELSSQSLTAYRTSLVVRTLYLRPITSSLLYPVPPPNFFLCSLVLAFSNWKYWHKLWFFSFLHSPYHLPAVYSWASYLSALCLSFPNINWTVIVPAL